MDEWQEGGLEADPIQYLRSGLPVADVFTDDELRDRLYSCVERGRAYGLETERQFLDFAVADCLLGEEFESDPENEWAAAVLNDGQASADERAAMLAALASIIVEDVEVEGGE